MAEATTNSNAAQSAATDTQKTETGAGKVNTNPDPNGSSTASQDGSKSTDLEALIQRAVDRATNKLGNENKKLRGELDTLKKEKLSADELKELEMKEKEKDIAERERAIKDRENRLAAIKAIKDAGLDDGSKDSLALVDFVMGEDEEAITDRVKVFKSLVERFVKAEVDRVFKSNGRNPGIGSSAADSSDSKKDNIGVRIGQNAAKANKAAKTTLDYYIGGKNK